MTGVKNDQEKIKPSLIPAYCLAGILKVFRHGSKKYSDWNWLMLDKERLLDAAERHLLQIKANHKIDKESKQPHVFHAISSLIMYAFLDKYGKMSFNKYKNLKQDVDDDG